jgi:tRNA G18 (ribose-2'-O)-methylase SpoU
MSAPADRLPYAATELSASYDALGPLPVIVLLDNVRSLYNVGAFFRTADAVGVEAIWLCGITATPPRKEIAKTALGTEDRVRWEAGPNAVDTVDTLRQRGYEIAAIETSLRAIDVFEWQPRFPVCVLFGHEVDGLCAAVLDRADTHIRLPMRGSKHSLNVATAGGVVLYELLRKYRSLAERPQP